MLMSVAPVPAESHERACDLGHQLGPSKDYIDAQVLAYNLLAMKLSKGGDLSGLCSLSPPAIVSALPRLLPKATFEAIVL